jgi:hypothetical protein
MASRDRAPKPSPTQSPRPLDREDLVPFGTRLPDGLARQVRATAALEGRSVQEWVADALREKLDQSSH